MKLNTHSTLTGAETLQVHTHPTLKATPSVQHRFHLLDALRGLVAVVVVFWHAPGYAKLPVQRNGFLAVDFFFCLSGFVIAFSYENRLETELSFKDFAVARFIRLYPIYIAALVSGLCVRLVYVERLHVFGLVRGCLLPFLFFELFMLPSAVTVGWPWLFPLDYPAWSIFFEILANFGYAGLVRARWASLRPLWIVFLGTAVALALWIGRGENLDQGATNSRASITIGIVRVTLSFVAGVLALRFLRGHPRAPWTATRSMVVAAMLTATLGVLLIGPYPLPNSGLFQVFILAVLFPGIVYLGALCRLPSAFTSPCALLGDLSYPVYLFHVHFLRVLQLPSMEALALRHPALRLGWVPTILLMCALFCYALLKFYDRPTRSYLQRRYKTLVMQKLIAS